MALRTVPISSLPDYEFTVELDRQVYLFRFLRNARSERFSFSIYTEAREPIVCGVPLVVNFPLLERFKDERLPPGTLFLWDAKGQMREPTDATLGVEHLLLYQEAE